MSRRAQPTEKWWQRTANKVIAKINFNTIFMAIIAGLFTTNEIVDKQEQSVKDEKKERIAKWDSTWKEKNNARWDSLFRTLKKKK